MSLASIPRFLRRTALIRLADGPCSVVDIALSFSGRVGFELKATSQEQMDVVIDQGRTRRGDCKTILSAHCT